MFVLANVVVAWSLQASPFGDPFDTKEGAISVSSPGTPAEAEWIGPPPDAELFPRTLFLNFGGAILQRCGSSNSPHDNCSTVHNGIVLPFTGSLLQRASIIQIVRARLGQFDIRITDERPEFGDYDMVMVGDWDPPPSSGNFAGIAPATDCWDGQGGEISFALEYTSTPDGMAEVILQEVAHTWGLSHVGDQDDLMYPTTAGDAKSFTDRCTPIVRDSDGTPGTSFCTHHSEACGSQSMQNSQAELMLILGPGASDVLPPTLELLEPYENAEVADDVAIVARVSDNVGPALLTMRVNLIGAVTRRIVHRIPAPAEYTITAPDLVPGEYELFVSLVDESNNVATERRWFHRSGQADTPTQVPKGSDPPTSPTSEGQQCTVAAPRTSRQRASWLVLFLVVLPRRRRRASAVVDAARCHR